MTPANGELFRQAVAELEAKNYEECLNVCEKILMTDPGCPDTNNVVGAALAMMSYYVDSITFFKRTLEKWPDSPDVHSNLSCSYANIGESTAAIYHGDMSMRGGAERSYIHINMGSCWCLLGSLSKGIRHFQRALKLDPKCIGAASSIIFTMDMMPEFSLEDLIAVRKEFNNRFCLDLGAS